MLVALFSVGREATLPGVVVLLMVFKLIVTLLKVLTVVLCLVSVLFLPTASACCSYSSVIGISAWAAS